MRLRVNGRDESLEKRFSLLEFLIHKGIRPETVACELNMNVIAREEFGKTELAEGDVLEIVKFVGGG